jgi:hypothetical protein
MKAWMEILVGGHWSKNIRGVDAYDREGLTYTIMARGALGVRILEGHEIFSKASNGIFPRQDIPTIAGLLNGRCISFLLRAVTQNLEFSTGYIERLPAPPHFEIVKADLSEVSACCISLKKQIVAKDACE